MSYSWTRLLLLPTQPASLRDCYELVSELAGDLRQEAPAMEVGHATDAALRLGYLISALRLVGGLEPHASWRSLEEKLRSLSVGGPQVLLAADPSDNPLDDLAHSWGLKRGLDSAKVEQIVTRGAV